MPFLPTNRKEMEEQGVHTLDFICVTGDAYVDHPSFGIAIISRVLESQGFKVGVIAQPNFRNNDDFKRMGKPKYGYFVTSGNIDSMVAHYTCAKRKRSDDYYTPGKKAGKRPDRAVIVYSKIIKQLYPDTTVVIGGLEASLRRFAHYDYWDDSVRKSILLDSGADILIYGMGEHQTVEIANRMKQGEKIEDITDIRGTAYLTTTDKIPFGLVNCPSFEQVCENKKLYAKSIKQQLDEQDSVTGRGMLQKHGKKVVIQNPPSIPLNTEELDEVFALPFMRTYHPSYQKDGGVPAIEEVEFSIMHNRGCFGGCNFCAITFHQGREVTSRSVESVVNEAKMLAKKPNFKGYIHDVGGPTANFRKASCKNQEKHGVCKDRKCLTKTPCKLLDVDHSEYLDILRQIRKIDGIKKVFVRSGIRYDYLLEDKDETFFKELVEHHISGQLKVAPEHICENVLDVMGKTPIEVFDKFKTKFEKITKSLKKEQYLVPYMMSSHPGSTIKDAIKLALYLKKNKLRPQQVQDFYPTPGTLSTCIYYTGFNPYTNEEVYVPRKQTEKDMQRALLQYFDKKNLSLVIKALTQAGRRDLIGKGENCLVSLGDGAKSSKYKSELSDSSPSIRKTHAQRSSKNLQSRSDNKPYHSNQSFKKEKKNNTYNNKISRNK